MASVDSLLDFDGPSLQPTRQSSSFATDNVNSVSLMDPFSANYQVRRSCPTYVLRELVFP